MLRKARNKIFLFILILIVSVVIHGIWCNQALLVTTYQVKFNDLPAGFDGYRIAQISDLHNTQFGKNNERLTQLLKDTQPDCIVITGDMLDSRKN